MKLSYLVTLAVGAACYGQDASVGTPTLGFLFDESAQTIHVIRGIPGAALVEDPLDPGFSVRSAVISSQRRFGLVTAGDSSVRLLRFETGSAAAEIVDGAMAAPDRMLLSSGGGAALLYRADRMQSISGLPERPIVRDWVLPSSFDTVAPLAVTDDAQFVATMVGGGDPSILLFSSDGSAWPLSLPAPAVAVAFHHSRRDLLAVLASGDVCLLRDIAAGATCRTFQAAGLPDATAVQFSPDAARAYIAGDGGVLVLDLDTGHTARVSCGRCASSLDPTGLENVFRVAPAGAAPVLLFDASKAEPRFWFVPRRGPRYAEGARR